MTSLLALLALGCIGPRDCQRTRLHEPGAELRCRVPDHRDRPMTVHLPDDYDAGAPAPAVVLLHGGGSDAEGGAEMTCPGGDTDSADCLSAVGGDRGYVVVFANGTAALLGLRTFNAGGGEDGWQCVSGQACADRVDDVAYFDAMLDELTGAFAVDPERIFFTGHSNGAAMSHRLACQRADRVAGIAANGAPNQYETAASCDPAQPVSVLQIHGTDDECMPWDGGENGCIFTETGVSLGIDASMTGWVERSGCDPTGVEEALPDTADDGTTSTRTAWSGCGGDVSVELVRVEGGGHSWPGGHALTEKGGLIAQDFQANEMILDFFDAAP